MLTLHISQADLEYVKYERFHYPCALIQKRLHVLYLKASSRLSHQTIAYIVGTHADTVTDYIRYYNQGGLERICSFLYGTNKSKLEAHTSTLLNYFEKYPPLTSSQACQKIQELTGIQRSPTQVIAWMKRHQLTYRKVGQIPSKADPKKQKEFISNEMNSLIISANKGDVHLLFMDASHFVMGIFLCCLWSIKRIFIKSSSGRKRYNVLGAVDAVTKKIYTLTNETYINAETICDFFEQLRNSYRDTKTIYIIMDNARYQKCELVRYVAWQFNVKLVYLPPYSPNLNIIERLWKWVKKEALYAKFYDNFTDFKKAIDLAIDKANNEKKVEIKSLFNLKFQTF